MLGRQLATFEYFRCINLLAQLAMKCGTGKVELLESTVNYFSIILFFNFFMLLLSPVKPSGQTRLNSVVHFIPRLSF